MGEEKSEEEVAQGFRKAMLNRGIKDVQAQLKFLRGQKIKKRDASKRRTSEAEMEIRVIDRMLEDKI